MGTMKKTEIIVGQIQINDLRAGSNLLQGDNIVRGWRTHAKTNYSLGRVNGDANLVSCRLNYLSDPDCIDMQVTASRAEEKKADRLGLFKRSEAK